MLFLDRIIEVEPGFRVKGLKCFTYNEWYFPAHFEDDPNVPGFIQIEVLVQTFIMTFLTLPEYKGMKTNFLDINSVKFRRKIIPGDTLIITADLNSFKRGIAKGVATGYVDDEMAVMAEFIVALPDILSKLSPRLKSFEGK